MATLAAVITVPLAVAQPVDRQGKTGNPSCTSARFRTVARQLHQPWYEPVRHRWRMRRLLACAPNVKTRQAMKRIRANQRAGKLEAVSRYEALTPYGRYAIPGDIVACESGGSWSAYNPSGAAGIYQIMPEHGRPFPVDSMSDKLEHHRIASDLWAGGAGASNWVCAG